MECFLVAVAFALVAAVLAGTILGIVALQRSRKLEARLSELDRHVSRLRREVGELRGAPARPETPRPAQARAREEAAFTREHPGDAPPETPSGPPRQEVPPAPHVPEAREGQEVPPATSPDARPPAPPSPPPPGPPGPREPSEPAIDWEQWIGVKGAAVLGGILFALAGLYFVRYSIEQGWLAPPVRVALGILAGLAAVVGSEVLRRRRYEPTANAVAGGGVVVL